MQGGLEILFRMNVTLISEREIKILQEKLSRMKTQALKSGTDIEAGGG